MSLPVRLFASLGVGALAAVAGELAAIWSKRRIRRATRRRYLDSLPTSSLKPGDWTDVEVPGCANGWRGTPQRIKVKRGDVIDGKVIR